MIKNPLFGLIYRSTIAILATGVCLWYLKPPAKVAIVLSIGVLSHILYNLWLKKDPAQLDVEFYRKSSQPYTRLLGSYMSKTFKSPILLTSLAVFIGCYIYLGVWGYNQIPDIDLTIQTTPAIQVQHINGEVVQLADISTEQTTVWLVTEEFLQEDLSRFESLISEEIAVIAIRTYGTSKEEFDLLSEKYPNIDFYHPSGFGVNNLTSSESRFLPILDGQIDQ